MPPVNTPTRNSNGAKQNQPDGTAPTDKTPEIVEDTLSAPENDAPSEETSESQNPSEEDVSAPTPPAEPTVIAEPSVDAGPVDDVNANIKRLDDLFVAFFEANDVLGDDPEHFRDSAKIASTIAKHVIAHPTNEVLDHLLKYFVDHKDGALSPENMLKGSTTLPGGEERIVGFLFVLFSDIAHNRIVSVSSSIVTSTLKRPQIGAYYARKIAGIRARQS